jgi:hypothetical protein
MLRFSSHPCQASLQDQTALSAFLNQNLPLIGLRPSTLRWASLVTANAALASTGTSPSAPPAFPTFDPFQMCTLNVTVNIEVASIPELLPGPGALAQALASGFSAGGTLSGASVGGSSSPGAQSQRRALEGIRRSLIIAAISRGAAESTLADRLDPSDLPEVSPEVSDDIATDYADSRIGLGQNRAISRPQGPPAQVASSSRGSAADSLWWSEVTPSRQPAEDTATTTPLRVGGTRARRLRQSSSSSSGSVSSGLAASVLLLGASCPVALTSGLPMPSSATSMLLAASFTPMSSQQQLCAETTPSVRCDTL